jgi:4-hydroxybenzoate polyprenyltransferase
MGLRNVVRAIAQIGRLSLLGGTWILIFLGAASVMASVSLDREVCWCLLVATAFHISVYAFNDVVDLPLDRTQPRRAASPLVQGAIGVPAVVAIASGAAGLALVGASAGGSEALLWMTLALALLLFYDGYGKRLAFPPISDALQGVGWAALVFFTAASVGGPNDATAWIGAYTVLTIMLLNGVSGSVRDLPNDYRHGARTTAIMLGARPVGSSGTSIPFGLVVYAGALQLVLALTLLLGVVDVGGGFVELRIGLGAVGSALAGVLLHAMLMRAPTGTGAWSFGLTHIVVTLLLSLLLVPGSFEPSFAIALGLLFGLPTAAVGLATVRWRRGI